MVAQNRYIAASVQPTPVAVASGATGDLWQDAIAGCDQTTVYACGTAGGVTADLTVNLGKNNGDTVNATQALINGATGGADTIVTTTYPFQIRAGLGNPLVTSGVVNDDYVITASNSIATIPLMDSRLPLPPANDDTDCDRCRILADLHSTGPDLTNNGYDSRHRSERFRLVALPAILPLRSPVLHPCLFASSAIPNNNAT